MMKIPNSDTYFLIFIILLTFYRTFSSDVHRSCAQKCANKVLTRKDIKYESCMNNCFRSNGTDWPLVNETYCQDIEVELEVSPACSAENMRVLSSKINVPGSEGNEASMREFIAVIWTPCPYGIGDVKGYEVEILDKRVFGYTFCKKVALSRKFGSDEIKRDFSVLFDAQELDYGANYEISVEGLPKTTHRHHAYITYTSMTCAELNGAGSCQCGLDGFGSIPPVDADVQGYHVNVTLKILNKCFNVFKYKLSLLYSENYTEALQTVDLYPTSGAIDLKHVFYSVYSSDPNPESFLFLQYHAFSKGGSSKVSEPTELSILEWVPNVSSISSEKNTINVTWQSAPENFNITKYEIMLNWYGLHSNDKIKHQTIHPHVCEKECFSPSFISKVLISVRPGIYSARVREWRPSSIYFSDPKWSAVSHSITVDYTEKNFINRRDLIVSASILFPVVIIVLIILGILFSLRKGYCKKIHHSLPFSVDRFLVTEDTFQHVAKSVWLVWQADNWDAAIGDLHAENIRHLAAFLANHCGLDVILDQYESSSSMGYSAWIQEKYKKADITVFICPHRAISDSEDMPINMVGYFSAVFRFYESSLLREENLSRFTTVLLPYSQIQACPASELLVKTTSVFRLMEEIENLYFFIQGCSKVTRLGRHVVKYINHIEYTQTSEGMSLKNGLENVCKLLNSESVSLPSSRVNIQETSEEPEDTSPPLVTGVKANVIDVVSPTVTNEENFLNKTRRFKPCPPPPLLDDEDADESMFLINTKDLLSLQPLTNEEIEPVTCETYCSLMGPSQHLAT